MHDIRFIRDNPDAFDKAMRRRGLDAQSPQILATDKARREKIAQAETLQAQLNTASKNIGAAKAKGDEEEFNRLREFVASEKTKGSELEREAKALDAQLNDLLASLPNLPHDDVPDGDDETDNVEIARWGTPREFGFAPQEHFEVPAAAACFDFERAARLSGSRFVVMNGALIRLHRALAQFMLTPTSQKTASPKPGRRCWSGRRPCSAPGNCQSSPRTAIRPRTAGGWFRHLKSR